MKRRKSADPSRALLFTGCLLWCLGLAATWPGALSFQDEIGYVGQVRALLEGQLRPLAELPGIWFPTAEGWIAKYPLPPALLLLPAFLVSPRAVFALAALAALWVTWTGSRALRDWDIDPRWSLLLLAHPTFVLMSRTTMPDLPLAAFAVASWWALRNERRGLAALWLCVTVSIKATGILLAAPLVAGEALRLWLAERSPRAALRCAVPAAGLLAGLLLTGLSNLLQTGDLAYGYSVAYAHRGIEPFAVGYLASSGKWHLASLLLLPPGLIFGLAPWWKRREWGVVAAIGLLLAVMAFYFYVDAGRTTLETLAIAQRLVLPAVAFLLLGYAALLARLLRSRRATRRLVFALALAAPAMSLGVGTLHARWQQPMIEARHDAETVLSRAGGGTLGLTYSAFKSGLLTRERVRWVQYTREPLPVILCSTEVPVYRRLSPPINCDFDGYRPAARSGTYVILVHE